MAFRFAFTPQGLPIFRLQVCWKRLPFISLLIYWLCQMLSTALFNLVAGSPVSLIQLLTIRNTWYTYLLLCGVYMLTIVFLFGKLYKRAKRVKRKRGYIILLIHIAVLTPVYIGAAILFHSLVIGLVFIITYTLYVGLSRLLIAKDLLFRIQMYDGATIHHY
ncbi:hypothetical protein SAMN05421788_11490 [Filimonas lacunae]|uniref:Uncharacterized protein n=1 Tax=Filimonas lacunae TaxID=477680 RepID=A0A1N7RHA1_9BACT|nr:hypothetical protein SAMN05421788_11490 [Filimonas lacunae]